MGCCKLCAWSGPGTPHLMGNSLNNAHLGRQYRLEQLIFCFSSQIARQPLPLPSPTYPAATAPGCSPRAIPAYLRPLAHVALVILIKLSYSVSGQACTNRLSYLLTEHSLCCHQGPNKSSCHRQQTQSPITSLLEGRLLSREKHLAPACVLPVILNICPRTLLPSNLSLLLSPFLTLFISSHFVTAFTKRLRVQNET